MEAAMMVMEPSVPPQMVTATVSAGSSQTCLTNMAVGKSIPGSPVSFGSMTILTNEAAPALCGHGVSGRSRKVVVSLRMALHNPHTHGNGNTKSFLDVQCLAHIEEDSPGQEGKENVGRAGPA
jgi:hypothetical protein